MNLCDDRQVVGVSCGDTRGQEPSRSIVVVPARIVYKLPENLKFAEAAMLEAVLSGASRSGSLEARGGEREHSLFGAGMIGLLDPAGCSPPPGCSQVFIADIDATRFEVPQRSLGRSDDPWLPGGN